MVSVLSRVSGRRFLASVAIFVGMVSSLVQLSQNSLAQEMSFGQRQLEQIYADRPDMKGVIPDGDPIFDFVLDMFEHGADRQRILWSNLEPEGAISQYAPATNGVPTIVYVTSDKKISGRDKWAALVFELHNSKMQKKYLKLTESLHAGSIGVEEYAYKALELEFQAMLKTAAFFRKHPLPKMEAGVDSIDYSHMNEKDTYAEYLKWAEKTNQDPQKIYRDYANSVVGYIAALKR